MEFLEWTNKISMKEMYLKVNVNLKIIKNDFKKMGENYLKSSKFKLDM